MRSLRAVLLPFMVLGLLSLPPPASEDAGAATSGASGIDAPVRFINVSEVVGLVNISSAQNWAWGDYNNDGYEDLLLLGTYLYRNNGPPNWDFTNATEKAGIYNTTKLWACWGDYDNDGWLDFFGGDINDPSADHLWHNNGDGTFTDVTEQAGHVTDPYPSHAPSWGDYDLDGYLDLYVCNWATNQTIYYPDKMWHNNGDGTFTDATVSSGADETANPAGNMGSCWGDYNNDGWPDLYVGCYFLRANYLYENRNGTFVNVAAEKGVDGHATRRLTTEYYGHSPGGALVDLDNDLNLDIYCSNNAHRDYYRANICDSSYFFQNNGPTMNYNFTDIFPTCGVPYYPPGGNEELYFGENFADWDNDGDQDMFLPLVHDDIDYAYSYMMRNNGNNTFTDVSNETGLRVWNTVASAFCDYDQDGDMDMIAEGKVPYQNGTYAHRLFQNQGNDNHWIGFKLRGTRINEEAIGARITITANGRSQMREVQSQTGTHSQGNSLTQHFGLGDYSGTVDAVIRWSPWSTQTLKGLQMDKVHEIREPGRSADLEVAKVTYPAPAQSGRTVAFQVEVRNAGDVAAVEYLLRLRSGSATGTIFDEVRVKEPLQPGSARAASMAWSPAGEGEKVLYFTVEAVHPRDPSLANNEYRCVVKVTGPPPENQPPRIISFSASKGEVLPNETVVLTVSASDPEGDPLSYSYSSSSGNVEGQGDSGRWIAPSEPGTYDVSVSVSDGRGHSARSTLSVKVKAPPAPPPPAAPENSPPRILSFKYEPAEPLNDGRTLLGLKVQAADPDGPEDLQRAVFDLREVGGPQGMEVTDPDSGVFLLDHLVPAGTEPGAKSVTAEVFDRAGASARKTIIIGVGSPPKKPAGSASGAFVPGPDILLLLGAVAFLAVLKSPQR